MLNIKIPKFKYNTTDYPNLEPRAIDMSIPERYGVKTNITPVCIDTSALKYKLAKREIKAIDAIVIPSGALVLGADYTEDLANAEFTLRGTPELQPNTEYYLVFEGDWPINAADWLEFYGWDNAYADGNAYEIDGGDVWSALTTDLTFVMYGKKTLDGVEELMLEQEAGPGDGFLALNLRDHVDRTKIAMKFKTLNNGISFFVTRIFPRILKTGGFPDGKLRGVTIYSDQGITPMGIDSWDICDWIGTNNNTIPFIFQQRELVDSASMLVDIQGYKDGGNLMENVADIFDDVLQNIAGVSSSLLDAAAFAALKAARTQDINPQLDKEITVGNFAAKLEMGQLFKFMPTLEGLFSPRFYAAGEPGGTPHLKDEDFIWFRSRRNLASVKRRYIIQYDEDATTQIYKEEETLSTVAEYIYLNKETLRLETYLKDPADALQLAVDYKGLLEYPQREIEFEVNSYLMDKIPTDKVKITRTRGDNAGGVFNAVLFRILKLTKRQSTGTVVCMAVLDIQTY